MKFLGQNIVPDIAAVVPSLFHGLSAGGAGFVCLPQRPIIGEPPREAVGTDDSSGVSRFR